MSSKRSERLNSGQRSPRTRLLDEIHNLEVGIRQHKAAKAPNSALLADFEASLEQLKDKLKRLPE